MSLDERPRSSARPAPREHYNSLPRTSIEGALGGVKGEQLEVLVEELPKDYYGLCGTDCVDIAPVSNDEYEAAAYFREVSKRRVFVLKDVKGDTVMIWFAGPPETFDKFAPKAQKVVDSVKWSGS
jgi:hypothetical protein